MHQRVKGIVVGAASGGITCVASYLAIGYTMAIAMPRDFPFALWDALVVFGVGAALVAFVVHLITTRAASAPPFSALVGFAATVIATLAVTGELAHGYKVLAAWLVGALSASAVHRWLGPNNTFNRTPLRGAG